VRYVGTGEGLWAAHGRGYRYEPSLGDRAVIREAAERIELHRAQNARRRGGYGEAKQGLLGWRIRGLLGELAALHPLGSGPELEVKRYPDSGGDFGHLEIRTTSKYQLYGFAFAKSRSQAGLGGWPVMAKDRGRLIVCVVESDEMLHVMGYTPESRIRRLPEKLGGIVAVIEPPELWPLFDMPAYAEAYARSQRGGQP
jgi:hypothetical protein